MSTRWSCLGCLKTSLQGIFHTSLIRTGVNQLFDVLNFRHESEFQLTENGIFNFFLVWNKGFFKSTIFKCHFLTCGEYLGTSFHFHHWLGELVKAEQRGALCKLTNPVCCRQLFLKLYTLKIQDPRKFLLKNGLTDTVIHGIKIKIKLTLKNIYLIPQE